MKFNTFHFLAFIVTFVHLPVSVCQDSVIQYGKCNATTCLDITPPAPNPAAKPPATQKAARVATAAVSVKATPTEAPDAAVTPTKSPAAPWAVHAIHTFVRYKQLWPVDGVSTADGGSSTGPSSSKETSFIVAGPLIIIFIIITTAVVIRHLRRKLSSDKLLNSQSVETYLKNHEYLAMKRFKYSDVQKMTNAFKDKLGQGAYGAVFKGKLFDGRMVAVKMLKESKCDGEEFINEVSSISRTSHVNIVALLGFCVEGAKRALIYEFMPNGSLEKFIYDENPLQKHPHLEWEVLYKIAIGIAWGLEYLHRGCNTRILHFDIKPHNILLDQDFSPKISDFGLAKPCLKKESIISMISARGTPGYIAPELIYRNFGGVSHKSDVYSYGMMVLEMVGERKNNDAGVENISEIYFPSWIHKHLETCRKLGLRGVTNAEDEEIVRKMILVGLWCIQMNPSNRPAMSKVLEMLEGSLDALQIPPMPFFSSPPRSEATASSTTSSTVDEEIVIL